MFHTAEEWNPQRSYVDSGHSWSVRVGRKRLAGGPYQDLTKRNSILSRLLTTNPPGKTGTAEFSRPVRSMHLNHILGVFRSNSNCGLVIVQV